MNTVIGVCLSYPKGHLKDVLDAIDEEVRKKITKDSSEPYLAVTLPCGERYIVETLEDFPVEDVVCSCGDKDHYFIKHEVT